MRSYWANEYEKILVNTLVLVQLGIITAKMKTSTEVQLKTPGEGEDTTTN